MPQGSGFRPPYPLEGERFFKYMVVTLKSTTN